MGARIKFRVSCLHGRHVTSWAITPAHASMFLTRSLGFLLFYISTLPLICSSRVYPWSFLSFFPPFGVYVFISQCGIWEPKLFASWKNTMPARAHHSPIYCSYVTIFKLVLTVYKVPTHKSQGLSQLQFLSSQLFVFLRVNSDLLFSLSFLQIINLPSVLCHIVNFLRIRLNMLYNVHSIFQ